MIVLAEHEFRFRSAIALVVVLHLHTKNRLEAYQFDHSFTSNNNTTKLTTMPGKTGPPEEVLDPNAAPIEDVQPSEVETLKTYLDDESKAEYDNIDDIYKKRAFVLKSCQVTKYYDHIWLMSKQGESPPEGRTGRLRDAHAFYCVKCSKSYIFSNASNNPSTSPIKNHLTHLHNLSVDDIAAEEEDASGGGNGQPKKKQKSSSSKPSKEEMTDRVLSILINRDMSYESYKKDFNGLAYVPSREVLEQRLDCLRIRMRDEIQRALRLCDHYHVFVKTIKVESQATWVLVGVRFLSPDFNPHSYVLDARLGGKVEPRALERILTDAQLDTDKMTTLVTNDLAALSKWNEQNNNLTKNTFLCFFTALNVKVLPHVSEALGGLLCCLGNGKIPGDIPAMYATIRHYLTSVPLTELNRQVLLVTESILKRFVQFFNWIRDTSPCFGVTITSYRVLVEKVEALDVDFALPPLDPQSKDDAAALLAAGIWKAKFKKVHDNIKLELGVHPFGDNHERFYVTIPLVPNLSAMNKLSEAEKKAVIDELKATMVTAQGLSQLQASNGTGDYGDMMSIQNQDSGSAYWKYYEMQTSRHTQLGKCSSEAEWWKAHGSEEFPELKHLARKWLSSSSICESEDATATSVLSTDEKGDFDIAKAKASILLRANLYL